MDETKNTTETAMKDRWTSIFNNALKVITNPAEFFRGMVKTGGFIDPLIFMVVMGVIAGVIQAVFGIFKIGVVGSAGMALGAIIFMPVAVLIGGFIGALILFVIWKLMGSQASYETAYRCGAYASAIMPITAIIRLIPYAGSAIGMAWMIYLLVTASVEVHKIAVKTAWIVFGIIGAILILAGLRSERTAGNLRHRMYAWEKATGKPASEMTPEDAGKAMGAFMKGMQESAQKAQQDAAKAAKESQKEAEQH